MKKLLSLLAIYFIIISITLAQEGVLSTINAAYQAYDDVLMNEKVYLHVDRTFYKQNEYVWFKAYVVDDKNQPSKNTNLVIVDLINPRGQVEISLKVGRQNQQVFNGEFHISRLLSGGIYTIRAYTMWQKNFGEVPFFEKEITIQKVTLPKLLMTLDFDKEAYGPGDEVIADLEVRDKEDKPLANASFEYEVKYNGKKALRLTTTTDAEGKANIIFNLPKSLNTNDALLNVLIPYEYSRESIARSIPIVLNDIVLQFFPEGGDMVMGMKNKVAFKALNEFGKPADIKGVVVDQNGEVITTLESYHQGMGAFELDAEERMAYAVKITQPRGIDKKYPLPKAIDSGVGLKLINQTINEIAFSVFSQRPQQLYLVGNINGELQYQEVINANIGEQTITLNTDSLPVGICQFTLFDSEARPHAERLAFLNKHRKITVEIKTDKEKYLPRERVNLTLKVTDETGKGVEGDFSMAVVEDRLHTFADDKQDNILSYLLMSSDLRGKIEEPNFYFDEKEEKADAALDYVLLTNGWRRYDWKDVLKQDADYWMAMRKYAPQQLIVRGKVLANHQPVKNAKISIAGKSEVLTVTDKNGEFQLENITLPTRVVAKYRGIKAATYFNQSHLAVLLDENPKPLAGFDNSVNVARLQEGQEVQVEATTETVAAAATIDVDKALAGRTAGVTVTASVPRTEVEMVSAIQTVSSAELSEVVVTGYGTTTSGLVDGYSMNLDAEISFNRYLYIQPENSGKYIYYGRTFYAPQYSYQYYYNPHTKQYEYRYSPYYGKRSDFRKTIHWQPNVRTNSSGEAQYAFFNSDEISTFRVIVEGITNDGEVARGEQTYFTQKMMNIDVKVPSEMTTGDRMTIPIVIKNNTVADQQIAFDINYNSKIFAPIKTPPLRITVPANQSVVEYATFKIGNELGIHPFEFNIVGEGLSDNFYQNITIHPKGFPQRVALAGMEQEKSFTFQIQDTIPNTLKGMFQAFPSMVDQLMQGVEGMLREPHGCFEQVSSSNYPNIMAMQYMDQNNVLNKEIRKKANKYMNMAYRKLEAYEVPGGGFDWYGHPPANEVLSAYGLLEFIDMKEVYKGVDEAMINRTARWLLSRRDGQGNWKSSNSYRWQNEAVRNAYITYAVSEAGITNIPRELEKVKQEALQSKDWYRLSLVTLAHLNIDEKEGNELLNSLLKEVKSTGLSNVNTQTTAMYSWGQSRSVESLSLVALAIMKAERYEEMGLLTRIIQELFNYNRGYGRFGSTQATVQALKAVTQYSQFNKKTSKSGKLEIYVNNELIETESWSEDKNGMISFDIGKYVSIGTNTMTVKFVDTKNPIPYAAQIEWQTYKPTSSPRCNLALQTTVESTTKVGENVRLTATMKNKVATDLPNPIALIGIPSGLSVQPWQLKELQEKGVFDFYEIQGNYLVLYYRNIEGSSEKVVNLDLKAEIPGTYKAVASTAYLYYDDEDKYWADGVLVSVGK